MKWITPVELNTSAHKIEHSHPLMMIGSCFSESVGEKLIRLKFEVDLNPFGILYNPASIRLCLDRLINARPFSKNELIEYDYLWHSFLHHSRFSSLQAETTLRNINDRLEYSAAFLRRARFLFITFGTAWVYLYKKTGQVVANCHKIPAAAFERRMLTIDEITADYRKLIANLKNINPHLEIIFTVSPVRHLKDTAIGNNISKATLLLAIHQLCRDGLATYFPAYEIMLDELRDYRFYASDGIHPSEMAVEYIFEKFASVYFSAQTKKLNQQIDEIQAAREHRIDFPQHPSVKIFAQQMLQRIAAIEESLSFLNFTSEKQYFSALLNQAV